MFAATSLAGQAILPAVGGEIKQNPFCNKPKTVFIYFQVLEEQLPQLQEEPEQLAVLPSVLPALASAACSRPGKEEGPYVHDPASSCKTI